MPLIRNNWNDWLLSNPAILNPPYALSAKNWYSGGIEKFKHSPELINKIKLPEICQKNHYT